MGSTGGTLSRPFWLLIIGLLVFTGSLSEAKIRYVLDFDGTLVNDHGPQSGWKTYWILKRVDHFHSSLQLLPPGMPPLPTQLEISFAEYQRLLPALAKEERILGDLRETPLDFDPVYPKRPQTFVPGYYRVSDDLSYANFRLNPHGKSYLLRDYADAKKREKLSGRKLRWQGGAFPLLRAALHPDNGLDSLVLSTARYQPGEDFDAWLNALGRDGYLPKIRQKGANRPRYHFLSSPESVLFGKGLLEKKVRVIQEEAIQLLNGPFPSHLELVPDEYEAKAGVRKEFHTLIVAEDDPVIIEALTRKLETLSSDLNFSQRVKFVLFNVGDDREVKEARWPWRWTVFDRGFARSALLEEIQLWAKSESTKNCTAILAGNFDGVGR